MHKILLTIFFGALIFFFGSVVAAQADFSCRVAAGCSNGETAILEMTSATNAHAGLVGSGYLYSLCCSDMGGLSSSCSNGNSEVYARLSGVSNAHVRAATESSYEAGTNACISSSKGSFEVAYRENNCASGEVAILSMAKFPTNAHIGGGSDYLNKICVKYTPPPNTSGGYLKPWPNVVAPALTVAASVIEKSLDLGSTIVSKIQSVFASAPKSEPKIMPKPASQILAVEVVGISGDNNIESSRVSVPIEQGWPSVDDTNSVVTRDNGNLLAAAGVAENRKFRGTWPKVASGVALLGLIYAGRRIYLLN